jgi:hypothetical protein
MKPHSASQRLELAALLALFGLGSTAGQAGELYFDFNRNINLPNASVFLFGNAGQTATVSTRSGFNQDLVLSAEGFFNLPIGRSFQQSGTGVRNTGFRVVSPDPIAGYFVNRAPNTTDMTYLLDKASLGTEYFIASDGGRYGEGSQVMIHATADNTAVTFTPKGSAPINVVLRAGETYKYAGGNADLTGSSVTATNPVAVFGGHECTNIPDSFAACDTLIEQMIPTNRLSSSYLVAASDPAVRSKTPGNGDLVRVIATTDNTSVSVNGVTVATLNAGDVHQFELSQTDGLGAAIDASAPVMVAQYLTGQDYLGGINTDPAMSLVPGTDTWLDDYRLATPAGAQAFTNNYAAIVIETLDLLSLLLDGNPVNTSSFTGIGGTAFSRGLVDLPIGLFTMSAASPFLLMLGGGEWYDSYLTYGGATFAPGISPPDLNVPQGVSAPLPAALVAIGLASLGWTRRRRAC